MEEPTEVEDETKEIPKLRSLGARISGNDIVSKALTSYLRR